MPMLKLIAQASILWQKKGMQLPLGRARPDNAMLVDSLLEQVTW